MATHHQSARYWRRPRVLAARSYRARQPMTGAPFPIRETPPAYGVPMDPARQTLLSVVSSLSRLLIRLHKLSHCQRELPNRHILDAHASHWTVSDLKPPSPWLDAANPNTAVSGAISAVALVQAHLLAMIEAPGDIDPRLAVRVLEHVCHGAGWSAQVRALAERLDFELPESPWGLHHGASLHRLTLPRRGQRHKDA